ncbi:ABC transporter permease [Streptomyces telluris]|uniref:ABC transporter permease n=1 Tax=Streptomyces telluris TaxID=2720021 RepID=A0A9X2LG55_9ACTN|nr:ABC transporter permease [Streptomyces telluris]MCQ8770620.1 ABC transporter permease [Streptomyces telluris]
MTGGWPGGRARRPDGPDEAEGVAFRNDVQPRAAGVDADSGRPGPADAGAGPVPPEAAGADAGGPLRSPPPAVRPARRITRRKLLLRPCFLLVLLLATWLWFRGAGLDSVARNSIADGNVWLRLRQHIVLTVVSTFFVLIIAIPLGILLTRRRLRPAAPAAIAVANVGQATPAIGLLALLVIWLGIGMQAALVGMVVYAVLPVLANTVAGLRAIDPTLVEAARGIGMSATGVLGRVELPLAVPLILAGVRTALVLNVGTATLAYFGGGGGLGDLIASGITNQRMPVLVLGSVLTVALALLVDWMASLAELLLRPRGLEAS